MDYESLYETATKALNSQIEINNTLQAENLGLRAALVWSEKLDSITVKDLREFFKALRGGLKTLKKNDIT